MGAIVNSFNGGETSRLLSSRIDLPAYQNGCRVCKNMIPLPHGGAVRRPGSKFVGIVSDRTKRSRLIPFVVSDTESIMLEFGEQKLRFYKDGDRILENGIAIQSTTKADPVSVGATSHGLSNGDLIRIDYLTEMTELNGNDYLVANSTTHAFDLQSPYSGEDVDGSSYGSAESTGHATGIQRAYTISTPYDSTEHRNLRYAQSVDVMYLAEKNHAVRKLTRSSDTNWALTEVSFTGGPFLETNTGATTIRVMANTHDAGVEGLFPW